MEKKFKRNAVLIRRKFNSYLVPGAMMIVATQLGNVVDSIFVSSMIDLDGMTAISLSFPVLGIIQILGAMMGAGSAAMISVLLGKRQMEEAGEVFSAGLVTVIGLSLLFTAAAPFVTRPVASLLTPSPVLAAYLEQYLLIFILCVPVINLCLYMANIMTIDNSPKLGAACFIIANAVNLILDYVFLKAGMGMQGSALSTVIGYTVGLLVIILYIRSPGRLLSFSLKKMKAGMRSIFQVVRAGAAQGSLYVMTILQDLTMNLLIQHAMGPDYLAIYAVCIRSVSIVRLFIEGVVGLVQTIGGVLFGEKDYYGVRALMKREVKVTIGLSLLLTAFFFTVPQALLSLFSFNKAELYQTAITCVRIFSFSLVFFAANQLVQVYYQATLHTSLATMNAVLEGYVFLVPLVYLLMRLSGIQGVCAGVVLTEALSFGFVWLYRAFRQRQGKLPPKGFLMIPEEDGDVLFDGTISSTENDAVQAAEELLACCREHGIPEKTANALCMAAEEMSVNIARHGYDRKRPCAIDIALSRADHSLILRLRDDGVSFNPTEYQPEEAEIYKITGIQIIRRMTDRMSYARVLNMNNTIIEVTEEAV